MLARIFNVPCTSIFFLYTKDNNQPPDAALLWKTYRTNVTHIACRMSSGDVCVKYTYIYNRAGRTPIIQFIYQYEACPW